MFTVQKRHAHKVWFVFSPKCEIMSGHPTRKQALAAAAALNARASQGSGPTAKVKDYRRNAPEGALVEVKVGDWVGFKSDHEQSGQIVKIERSKSMMGGYDLHLHNENGFGGDYLRYAKDTVEHAGDCWAE